MMRGLLLAGLLLTTSALWAAATLPLEFDADPGWQPRPPDLGNPTAAPEITAADGVVTLRVTEAGKGMKFRLPVQPFDAAYAPYLLIRYKAQNLAGGYALWVMDARPGGLMVLDTAELTKDGQWHELALDLTARGAAGGIQSLHTEVQCAGQPAWISFDYVRLADEAPPGAQIIPLVPATSQDLVLKLSDLPTPTAQPGWLSAKATVYGADRQDGAVHLWAEGTDQGMKWSVGLPEKVDLSQYAYASLRYRARNTLPWGDYLVWLGSAPGGMPDDFATLLPLALTRPDNRWHLVVVPLSKRFQVAELALQACSAGGRGEVWLDSIRFSARRPLVDLADVLPWTPGWEGGRLPTGSFNALDLSAQGNTSAAARARVFGLKSWLPEGKACVQGVPLLTGPGNSAVMTSPELGAAARVSVGAKASELYLLMIARPPDMNACRMGDPVPMDGFDSPDRFRFRVAYADGVTEEMFPVACGTGRHEIIRGPEVYCLPNLRPVAIRDLTLLNRTEIGSFLVAAVTLNQGKALTTEPTVPGLAPPPKLFAPAFPTAVPAIKPIRDGFSITSPLLSFDLLVQPGVSVRPHRSWAAFDAGPLFELGDGTTLLDSTKVQVGPANLAVAKGRYTLTVPVSGAGMSGQLVVEVGPAGNDDIRMRLDLTNTGGKTLTPVVNFPLLRNVRVGRPADTWYLFTRKGGLLSDQPTHQRAAYGGEHPLQVDDIFGPASGYGLAVLTYDQAEVYRTYDLTKDEAGVSYRIEYWPQEVPAGGKIATAPTALRGHRGDWRTALDVYRQWTKTWFKPLAPRKPWFQGVFYYQQSCAWGGLRDQQAGQWRISEFIKRCRDNLGCLDYLHIFDFGESRIYGRVGDYNHYEELGGLPAMRAAVKEAQDQGVRMGLYIEGYLCDERGLWGKENCGKFDIRRQDGKPLLWAGTSPEHMMCPATDGWRNHLAETYRRVAGELQPDGMYIDQYGFLDRWKTCWSREHGHPVPMAPMQGEGETTRAIRQALPPGVANLTEETPHDVHAQYQDGALGYSVTFSDAALAPHRVDLFRFLFPDFKVLQLTSYNNFTQGGWDLLKFPFFNGEGWWLGGDPEGAYCPDAKAFLKQAFAILHKYSAAFTSADVWPLVPTLRPTVYANEFRGAKVTAWTLFNAEYRTFRGELLHVPHRAGTVYRDAFTGSAIKPRFVKGEAFLPVTVGPRDVGCVVAER